MDSAYSLDFTKPENENNDDNIMSSTGNKAGAAPGAQFIFNADDGAAAGTTAKPNWWKRSTVYQIWPASFKDGNGDGLGDLPGILTKLDYLKSLGVDVVWLSPMYASPQVDMGYDISDYNAIDPPYGTMEDMDAMIQGLHQRGMKILLDLVINHTSDQHEWFKKSSKSKDESNKWRDWYMWKDPKYVVNEKDGTKERHPPNNWGAAFGGSAWEWEPQREQYYLHLFAKEQPDLNWECEEAREAIYDSALRFWFEKGVDGFRIDTGALYSKVPGLPDGVVDPHSKMAPYAEPWKFCSNGPRIHEFYQEIRKQVLDHYGDPMMVGEIGGLSEDELMKYIGGKRREISMVFDFDFVMVGGGFTKPWHEIKGKGYSLLEVKAGLQKTQDLVMDPRGGWSSMFAENHDIPRSVSKFGTDDPKYREKSAKLLAILLGTLSGTLFLYQGQEIGMTNIPESWGIEDCKDLASINYYNKVKEEHPGDEEILRKAWLGVVRFSRDNARTPMQWNATDHAGFTTAQPWMRVNDNYREINVADQLHEKDSVINFWKKMIAVRKEYGDLFMFGGYELHDADDENIFTFEKIQADKKHGEKKALVMLNFSAEEQSFKIPKSFQKGVEMRCVISNEEKPSEKLGPWEGRAYVEV